MEQATTKKRKNTKGRAPTVTSELVTQGGLKFRIQLYYTAIMCPAIPYEAPAF